MPLSIVMSLGVEVVWLLLLALPIASISWTITHEEIFREPRQFCQRKSQECRRLVQRKFFYVFTCEYCLSHYVTIFFLIVTRYRLLLDDWRGYLIAFFALVAIANVYMSSFGRLRQEVKSEKLEAEKKEKELGEPAVVPATSLAAAPRPAEGAVRERRELARTSTD
jgi:hypothetical protein